MKPLTLIALLLPCVALSDVTGVVSLSNGRKGALAVVWLEGSGKKPKPLGHAVIDQREKMFWPHVLAVPVGTTVQFPNDDVVFHNVFAEYDAKRFDLGMYPRGSTRRETFAKAGLVALFCSVHSQMSAYIMVVDSPYYAVADGAGRFDLKSVPAGTYTLRAWHESGELTREKIRVTGAGQTVEVKTQRPKP